MPPDAGHGKRESAPATILGCNASIVLKPSCLAFAKLGKGRYDRLKTNVAGETPATASHACMTMTVVGLPSRRHESRAFPIIHSIALYFSPWRVAPTSTLFLFLPASPHVSQCSHSAIPDGISCHFRCWGKGNFGIVRDCKVKPPCGCLEKSPPSQAQVVFFRQTLHPLIPTFEKPPKRKRLICGRQTSQGNIGHTERRKEKRFDPTLPIRTRQATNKIKLEYMRMTLNNIGKALRRILSAVVTATSGIALCAGIYIWLLTL